MPNLILITGDSASGKSSLGRELKKLGMKEIVSFTTRTPRGDEELDEKVFCNSEQFAEKLSHLDFIATTNYNGNLYGLSRWLPSSSCFAIVDPPGRDGVRDNETLFGHNIVTVFLDIDEGVRQKRLSEREDGGQGRMNDSFQPTNGCMIVNGETDSDELARMIFDKFA